MSNVLGEWSSELALFVKENVAAVFDRLQRVLLRRVAGKDLKGGNGGVDSAIMIQHARIHANLLRWHIGQLRRPQTGVIRTEEPLELLLVESKVASNDKKISLVLSLFLFHARTHTYLQHGVLRLANRAADGQNLRHKRRAVGIGVAQQHGVADGVLLVAPLKGLIVVLV